MSDTHRIAVVGMGGVFPDADNIDTYWHNIISGKVSIGPAPESNLAPDIFYRPEYYKAIDKKDKSITQLGGWIKHLDFDSRKYRIPPAISEQMSQNQISTLMCAEQALSNGVLDGVDKKKTAVIIGGSMFSERYVDVEHRIHQQKVAHQIRNNDTLKSALDSDQVDRLVSELYENTLVETKPVTEDTAPGILINVTAGRIANVFDIHGPAFVVEGACASGLTAIANGVQGLESGQYDAVLCGASDMVTNEASFIMFSALNALSPNGSFPFDQRADGFIIGQGAGLVVLKRLEDAVENNDPIYAVIRGYGQYNDGKGKYIAAPNPVWQANTIEAAYQMAGFPVDTVEFIEAHGTGTPVGDAAELQALKESFHRLSCTRKNYCGIGSVKSNIGHLKSAAGIAGFIKTALSLHHKVLPPTANVKQVSEKLEIEDSPFYILTEAENWKAPKDHPRRAGVSSFGFGGCNWHIALEEFDPEMYRRKKISVASRSEFKNTSDVQRMDDPVDARECFFLSSDSHGGLERELETLLDDTRHSDFTKVAMLANSKARHTDAMRMAIVAASPDELDLKAGIARTVLENGNDPEDLEIKDIYFSRAEPVPAGRTAVMFPGQGSQYPGMLKELYAAYATLASRFLLADNWWMAHNRAGLNEVIFPAVSDSLAAERLRATEMAQPALYTAGYGMFELLQAAGLKADYMIGHSLGEITALAASGRIGFGQGLEIVSARANAFTDSKSMVPGKMIALGADEKTTADLIEKSRAQVYIANLNSPYQTIVSGMPEQLDALKDVLAASGIGNTILNVSQAFHSPLINAAKETFGSLVTDTVFARSGIRVMANHLATVYPEDSSGACKVLVDQLTAPVRFMESMQYLYDKGVRLFVEAGPGNVLSRLAEKIFEADTVTIIPTDAAKGSQPKAFKKAMARLFCAGVPLSQLPENRLLNGGNRFHPPEEIGRDTGEDTHQASTAVKTDRQVLLSGASIGLPGSGSDSFSDDNFSAIFQGKSFIEPLTPEKKQSLVDLNITKLVKTETGAGFKVLSALNEVIQLVSYAGRLNLKDDFLMDDKEINIMSTAIGLGVAAGYEALKDARIPLVRDYKLTASGARLAEGLVLPEEMQQETGIISANGFPMVEPVVREVSKFVSASLTGKLKSELLDIYDDTIQRIEDRDIRNALSEWYAATYMALSEKPNQKEIYQFNHNFMNQIANQANNRLAQLVHAKGPNFLLHAACSSTSVGLMLAEDMVRSGRVKRMIVLGSDDPTNKENMPWIGAGFLSVGTATTESDPYCAAVPFDQRRNGMILGSGAIGMVVEDQEELKKRGVNGVCEILGSHSFNTASHPQQMNLAAYGLEMECFIERMEDTHGIDRHRLAKDLIYMSHETYTPPRGGCAQSETMALKRVFGRNAGEVIMTNTKGMTGHTMGAALEDAVAAKALQYGKVPPVVNCRYPDEEFSDMHLSKGEDHNRRFAIHMTAGFGSQGTYSLFRKVAEGDERVVDRERYNRWLTEISGNEAPELELKGRILAVKEAAVAGLKRKDVVENIPGTRERNETRPEAEPGEGIGSTGDIQSDILEIFSKVTRYPVEMLEPDMELEADLGIDTVKQATVLSMISEQYGLVADENIKISDYRTIGDMVRLFREQHAGAAKEVPSQKILETVGTAGVASAVAQHEVRTTETVLATGALAVNETAGLVETPDDAAFLGSDAPSQADIQQDVLKIMAELTRYPEEMLEPDMELEADLGIDTVKQATVLSMIGEKYGFHSQEDVQLSDYHTIGDMVQWILKKQGARGKTPPQAPDSVTPAEVSALTGPGGVDEIVMEIADPIAPELDAAPPAGAGTHSPGSRENIRKEVLRIFSRITRYPEEMLELDMELEADLGIDTVKQATVLSMLAETYGLGSEVEVNLNEYRTIADIIGAIREKCGDLPGTGGGSLPESSAPEPPAPELSVPEAKAVEAAEDDLWTEGLEVSRQVPVLTDRKIGEKEYDITDKKLLLLGSCKALLQRFERFCKEKGARTLCVVLPLDATPENAETLFRKKIEPFGPDAVFDCSHVKSRYRFAPNAPDSQIRILAVNSDVRFALYRCWETASIAAPERILLLTAMDGGFGFSMSRPAIKDPCYGALAGFYKALAKEWPGANVTCLDIYPGIPKTSEPLLFSRMVDEMESADRDMEVAYSGDLRKVVRMRNVPALAPQKQIMENGSVFVVTGGTSGITGPILNALSSRFNIRLAVLGRTVLPKDIQALSAMGEPETAVYRKHLTDELKKKHGRVTPVMVQQELDHLKKAVSIYRTLESIRSNGGEIEFYSCDVTDQTALGNTLARVRERFGPINGILHAAGIDQSRGLAEKSVEEFCRVFATKAASALYIDHFCSDDPIKYVYAFGSISGRFGNASQTDYSAANAFLEYWIKHWKTKHPECHAVSFNWSAWKDLGMAWENETVRTISEESGIHFIEPEAGTGEFIRTVTSPNAYTSLVVHKGLGDLVDPGVYADGLSDTPMIDRAVTGANGINRVFKKFHVRRDPVIGQHRLGDTCLLPGVAAMEMCMEYYTLEHQAKARYLLRDIAFHHPFKLFRDQSRELYIEGHPSPDGKGMAFEYKSVFVPKAGMGRQVIPHGNMVVCHDDPATDLPDPEEWGVKVLASDTFPMEEYIKGMHRQVSPVMNLGPLFNGDYTVSGPDAETISFNPRGVFRTVYFPPAHDGNPRYPLDRFQFNPCFFDFIFQAGAMWCAHTHKRTYLPYEVREARILDVPREPGMYTVYGRLTDADADTVTFEAMVKNPDGIVHYHAKDILFHRMGN